MRQFCREINDAVKTKLALDSRGLPLRDENGFPIIESEILYQYDGRQTAGLNCHSGDSSDKKGEIIRNERIPDLDEWQ
jgi:hypothetical protein